jgi:hypothetical protein
MTEQEKVIFNDVEGLRQYFEALLSKRIDQLKQKVEKLKKSETKHCDETAKAFEGLLFDMSNDLKLVKQAKVNPR